MKKILITTFVLVLVLLGFSYWKEVSLAPVVNKNSTSTIPSGGYPGLQMSLLPWFPEIEHLKERLGAIGLLALKEEGTALHTHQHIDIYINGKHTDVPADIGVNEKAGFISPIHVHDETNIIHVESPTVQKFTLGQFFDVWGVRFSDACIGGYCSDTESKLKVFVNGKEVLNSFRDIELIPHEEIVVIYGKEKDVPSPIPSVFNFPKGL